MVNSWVGVIQKVEKLCSTCILSLLLKKADRQLSDGKWEAAIGILTRMLHIATQISFVGQTAE
jgi:hypothetical protein